MAQATDADGALQRLTDGARARPGGRRRGLRAPGSGPPCRSWPARDAVPRRPRRGGAPRAIAVAPALRGPVRTPAHVRPAVRAAPLGGRPARRGARAPGHPAARCRRGADEQPHRPVAEQRRWSHRRRAAARRGGGDRRRRRPGRRGLPAGRTRRPTCRSWRTSRPAPARPSPTCAASTSSARSPATCNAPCCRTSRRRSRACGSLPATSPAAPASRSAVTGGTSTTSAGAAPASGSATSPGVASPPPWSWARRGPRCMPPRSPDCPRPGSSTLLDLHVADLVRRGTAARGRGRRGPAPVRHGVVRRASTVPRAPSPSPTPVTCPLLVRRPGSATVAVHAPPGPPLGIGTGGYMEVEVPFGPGCLLAAFTDGLVESSAAGCRRRRRAAARARARRGRRGPRGRRRPAAGGLTAAAARTTWRSCCSSRTPDPRRRAPDRGSVRPRVTPGRGGYGLGMNRPGQPHADWPTVLPSARHGVGSVLALAGTGQLQRLRRRCARAGAGRPLRLRRRARAPRRRPCGRTHP